jgi:hypothetical protein
MELFTRRIGSCLRERLGVGRRRSDGHGLGLGYGFRVSRGIRGLTRGYRLLFATGLGLPGHKEEFRIFKDYRLFKDLIM